jgi:hypothetical protein
MPLDVPPPRTSRFGSPLLDDLDGLLGLVEMSVVSSPVGRDD